VAADRAGSMEIIAGGGTYEVDGAQGPLPRQASRPPDPSEAPEEELSRTSIVPDRFDDLEAVPPPAPFTGTEGVDPIWPSPAPISSPGHRESDRSGTEAVTSELVSEPWDELASGLSTPSSVPEIEAKESRPLDFEPVPERTPPATAPVEPPTERSAADPPTPPGGPAGAAELSASPGQPGLSPEELERVISLVVGQMSDRVIREIAWEVIPELAESLIKKRIHELEEKVSREG
jgi:hypothetical protein